MKKKLFILLLSLLVLYLFTDAQIPATNLWHGKERPVSYRPEGETFVTENGKLRFNRALYGSNTGFRVEAGDLPEFAL